MREINKVVDATTKEEKKVMQSFFFPSVGITIEAESLEDAKKQLKNIS